MSRISKALVAAVLVVSSVAGVVHAQHGSSPFVYVTFDGSLDQNYGFCKGIAVIDTLSVVAFNIPEPISGIAFGWTSNAPIHTWGDPDIVLADSSLGYSTYGIELFWNEPVYAVEPTIIHKLQVVWLCDDCDIYPTGEYSVTILPHPSASGGFVEATRWPDGATINALGLTSLVCPTGIVRTGQSTWGAIKALYQ
jgi:hypothetical protein